MYGSPYEDPADLKQRISGADPRPTQSEIREAAVESLKEGVAPTRTRTSEECPECGHKIPTVEEHGPDVDGLRATLRFALDAYSGTFTEEEFYEVVAQATAEVLDEEVDEEQTAEVHETLDEFEISRETKRLRFAEEWVDPILDGRKTATVRYDDEKDLRAGDRLELVGPDGETFAHAGVIETATCRAMEALSYVAHYDGDYPTNRPAELISNLNDHYDDEIGVETEVKVVVFEVEEGDT